MAEDRLTIGVLSPLLAGAFFGRLMDGIARRVAAAGGRVVAIQTLDAALGDRYPAVPPFEEPVGRDEVAGYIAVINAVSARYLEAARSQGKPVVTISGQVQGFECPAVLPDNTSGVLDAVEHLVAHGHHRIAFASNPKGNWVTDFRERHEAYVTALRRHGLPDDPELFFSAPSCMEEDGAEVARQLLAAGVPCTAVVAVTDLMAAGIMRALAAAGMAVPARLAVVGFDDRDFASQLKPALSTVRLEFKSVGEAAAGLLLDLLDNKPVANGEHRVRCDFIARESCGCNTRPVCRGVEEAAGAEERLRYRLEQALCGHHGAPEQARVLNETAEELAAGLRKALKTRAPDTAALQQAAEALFAAFPRGDTVPAVMEALQQYRRDLLCESYSPEALAVLDECVRHVSLALSGAQLQMLARSNESLQASLHNEYYVSMGLVGLRVGLVGLHSEHARPRSLEWLAGTRARRACLALWEDRPQPQLPRTLRVSGYYGDGLAPNAPIGSLTSAAVFPMVEDLLPEGCPSGELVFVLPVKTASRDWGLLAVSGPAEVAANTGRDIYFQWGALLAIALDHDALVESLQCQRQDLADAYRRERELVADVRASEERYALAASG